MFRRYYTIQVQGLLDEAVTCPARHQSDQDTLQTNRAKMESEMNYSISDPRIIVGTVRQVQEIVSDIAQWLGYEQ